MRSIPGPYPEIDESEKMCQKSPLAQLIGFLPLLQAVGCFWLWLLPFPALDSFAVGNNTEYAYAAPCNGFEPTL